MTPEITKQPLIHLVLVAVALAMGIVTIVLSVLGSTESLIVFPAIGVTALALHQLLNYQS